MTAEILQFIPKANPNRAFWIGPEPDPLELLAFEIMNQVMPVDTAPSEYSPGKDSA